MRLSKSTRYALYAAMEMAQAGEQPVSVRQVALRYRIPAAALAKVFQQLVRSGIALGARGIGGGYRLARPASRLTVLDLIVIYEPPRAAGQCLLAERTEEPCRDFPDCRLRRLFDEVDEVSRSTLQSVTLETLVRRAPGAAGAAPTRRSRGAGGS
jgi:Rrf2 family protein